MKVAEWAELCLKSSKVEDKLFFPEKLEWSSWEALTSIPQKPGRPKNLRFSENKERTQFPSLHHLEEPRIRGQILHFFANHELLALELMALTILKFPKAPRAFLQGIVNTLKDEQKHLRFYLEKMQDYGVEFGEVAVNDFFWKTLAIAETPLEYTTGMALTFEQANLDFSLYYQKAFEKIGDKETAEVLHQVYVDEISHVAYGVHWFEKLRPKKTDFWSEYSASLKFPITPQRAKGKSFDVPSRLQAGLSHDFIDQLKLYSHSKGRMPDVFYFNPDCEDEWALGKSYNPSVKTQKLKEDLETLPAFLCHSSDIVLVNEIPDSSFLKSLQRAGIELPEFQQLKSTEPPSNTRRVRSLQPWGQVPSAAKHFDSLKKRFQFEHDIPPLSRQIFSKSWSVNLLRSFLQNKNFEELINPKDVGITCSNYQELRQATDQFIKFGHDRIVFKAPFGASGRNFQWLQGHELEEFSDELPPTLKKWCQKIIDKQGELVVEPWLKKEFDYSLQIQVNDKGQVTISGTARFLVNDRGGYRGALLGGFHTGLKADHLRFLNREGQEQNFFKNFNRELADFVAQKAKQENYTGPIGIDAFVFRDLDGNLKIKPIVETNCRWNMGRLVVQLEKKLNLRGVGLWQVIPYDGNFIDRVKNEFSPLSPLKDDTPFSYLIASPTRNKYTIALLLTGPSLEKIEQKLQAITC